MTTGKLTRDIHGSDAVLFEEDTASSYEGGSIFSRITSADGEHGKDMKREKKTGKERQSNPKSRFPLSLCLSFTRCGVPSEGLCETAKKVCVTGSLMCQCFANLPSHGGSTQMSMMVSLDRILTERIGFLITYRTRFRAKVISERIHNQFKTIILGQVVLTKDAFITLDSVDRTCNVWPSDQIKEKRTWT